MRIGLGLSRADRLAAVRALARGLALRPLPEAA